MKRKLLFILLTLIGGSSHLYAQNEINSLRNYLQENSGIISQSDASEMSVSSAYRSPSTGWYHMYMQQNFEGVPVYNRIITAVLVENEVRHLVNQFESDFETRVIGSSDKLKISPETALLNAVRSLNIAESKAVVQSTRNTKSLASGKVIKAELDAPALSSEPVQAQLYWYPVSNPENPTIKQFTAVWNIEFEPEDPSNVWSVFVNANDGSVVETIDRVVHCSFGESAAEHRKHNTSARNQIASTPPDSSYRVFDYPLESPIFGNRTLVSKPYDKFAPMGTGPGTSNGWHEDSVAMNNYLAGNNVWAYQDVNSGNAPVSTNPSSANLNFDFSYSTDSTSASNQNAAVTNLFYWNNLIHDVLWRYGFDEPSGNFQTSTMGRGGLGSDYVRAEAQDGGGTNNANFFTPVDGQRPRMQMYLWTNGTDGDFDNGIIAHEYGHGWSNRLTGGP
ncbi:M36 family metallopeptidase, partial [Jiulongibacter sediminis]